MEMDEATDTEVLARSRTHPELLGLIYERHAPAVFRYLARRAGPVAAEDLLGEVFVAVVEARLRVQPHASGSALPWLYGIAGNVLRTHLRRSRFASPPDPHVIVDWDAIDERVDATTARRQLRAVLDAVSGNDREIFLLVAWEGLTPTEAAEALGLTPVAARSRLHRARMHAQTALRQVMAAAL